MPKILIACDSFKDALGAAQVCRAIAKGVSMALPDAEVRLFPLADGGEGVFEVLQFHLRLQKVSIVVNDPIFRKITASYGLSNDGKVAFIELAQASGLQLLAEKERNPLKTTTFGVGEMIFDAYKKQAKTIILGLGGSATHDLGMGMANALGWHFLDENNNHLIPVGENLMKIKHILPPKVNILEKITVKVMCDVSNPLLGKNGAAQVYARQKGANDEAIEILENGAISVVEQLNVKNVADTSGAGAAGGMGFGAMFFLNGKLQRGIDLMMQLTDFERNIAWADIIFTGEGRLDEQTAQGKLISGIASKAKIYDKKVIALCGAVEASPQNIQNLGLMAAFSIAQKPCTLQEALIDTAKNLEQTAFNIAKLI